MKDLLPFFFLILSVSLSAQQRDDIQGRVLHKNGALENVFLQNVSTGQSTATNNQGQFYIKAFPGDTLVFSHVGFVDLIKILKASEFKREELHVQMKDAVNELPEVNLSNTSEINAVSLGIIPHEIKTPTMNERRLKTAGDFKWVHLLGILGGNLQIDPILNAINGRTKKLKRNITVEKKLRNYAFLEGYSSYMLKEMKLTEEEIARLISLAVEENNVQLVIDSNNDNRVKFFLLDTWLKFQKVR